MGVLTRDHTRAAGFMPVCVTGLALGTHLGRPAGLQTVADLEVVLTAVPTGLCAGPAFLCLKLEGFIAFLEMWLVLWGCFDKCRKGKLNLARPARHNAWQHV